MNEKNPLLQIIQLANEKREKGQYLTEEQLRGLLNKKMAIRTVSKGGYITSEESTEKKVYFVLSGIFLMMRGSKEGKNNILDRKKAPQLLGIDRAVFPGRYTFPETVTEEDCLVLSIDSSYFIQNIKEDAELEFEIIKVLCERLTLASYRTDWILFYSASERLMLYIIKYWNQCNSNNKIPGQRICTVKIKNSYIAEDVGVSIRTFYRTMNALKEKKLITVVKGNITVSYDQVQEMKIQCREMIDNE